MAERPEAVVSCDRPDKRQVRLAFSAAAERYDGFAELQRAVADRLIARLALSPVACASWLDVGTGTGYCASHLARLFPEARATVLDLAEGMLRRIRRAETVDPRVALVAGDAEALPFASGSIDLVVSNLVLQWCPEPEGAIGEFARVLKPGGRLFFTAFGPGTLFELREAWACADRYSHVNTFHRGDDLTAMMIASGLDHLSLDSEVRVVRYADVAALMGELKGLGAHNVTARRRRGLTGKDVMARMVAAYRSRHAMADGGITASFELLYGAACREARRGSGRV